RRQGVQSQRRNEECPAVLAQRRVNEVEGVEPGGTEVTPPESRVVADELRKVRRSHERDLVDGEVAVRHNVRVLECDDASRNRHREAGGNGGETAERGRPGDQATRDGSRLPNG